jgi:hypothetical protein
VDCLKCQWLITIILGDITNAKTLLLVLNLVFEGGRKSNDLDVAKGSKEDT